MTRLLDGGLRFLLSPLEVGVGLGDQLVGLALGAADDVARPLLGGVDEALGLLFGVSSRRPRDVFGLAADASGRVAGGTQQGGELGAHRLVGIGALGFGRRFDR